MMTSDLAIEIKGLNRSFRTGFWLKRTPVLHDVNLAVPKKSVFGFLGPNGAGKTTLIQMMIGFRAPESGSVHICGVPPTSPEARRVFGYLPERPYFYEHLTADRLLRFFGRLSGLTEAQLEQRIPETLRQVNLEHARHRELRKYSKGMLQRVGIAQSILHDPELLILDEPMSGLDPVGRREIRDLIVQLARNGKTVFFSTHVIPDVEAICDQVGIIKEGRIVGSGAISSLMSTDQERVEVISSNITVEAVKALGVEHVEVVAHGIRTVVKKSDLNVFLQQGLAKGMNLHSVQALRNSLEENFFR